MRLNDTVTETRVEQHVLHERVQTSEWIKNNEPVSIIQHCSLSITK